MTIVVFVACSGVSSLRWIFRARLNHGLNHSYSASSSVIFIACWSNTRRSQQRRRKCEKRQRVRGYEGNRLYEFSSLISRWQRAT